MVNTGTMYVIQDVEEDEPSNVVFRVNSKAL